MDVMGAYTFCGVTVWALAKVFCLTCVITQVTQKRRLGVLFFISNRNMRLVRNSRLLFFSFRLFSWIGAIFYKYPYSSCQKRIFPPKAARKMWVPKKKIAGDKNVTPAFFCFSCTRPFIRPLRITRDFGQSTSPLFNLVEW